MAIPNIVFLETTALVQLGSKFQTPEFANLLELRDLLGFELAISEVSLAEYVRQRCDLLDELAGDVRSVAQRFANWDLDGSHALIARSQVEKFKDGLAAFYDAKAKEAGIRVLSIPTIDIQRLLRMSIDRTAPFEQSKDDKTEKGFRDALILFSILEEICCNFGCEALVVTNDRLIEKGLNDHAAEYEATVTVVRSLDEAAKRIEKAMTEDYRRRLLKESEEAKRALECYSEQINEQIQQISELTDFDLGVSPILGALSGERVLEVGENLDEIRSLSLDKIESAVWRDKDKAQSRILFRARCLANVTTSVTRPFDFKPKAYNVGKPTGLSFSAFGSLIPVERRDRMLPISLFGEARFERTQDGEKLVDIKVYKNEPSDEEMAILRYVPT